MAIRRVTQRFIREAIARGSYIDINRKTPPEGHRLDLCLISVGTYGPNGKVWIDMETGDIYATAVRSLAIFKY